MELKGSREVGLLVGLLVAGSRAVEAAPLWVATVLIVGVAVAGTLAQLQTMRFCGHGTALTLPALAAFAAVGGAHLLPLPFLIVAAPAAAAGVALAVNLSIAQATLTIEGSIVPVPSTDGKAPAGGDNPGQDETAPTGAEINPDPSATTELGPSHAILQAAAFGLGFLALAAVGGVVPNGLGGTGSTLTPLTLIATVALDAVIAGVMGYRLVALSGLSGRPAAVAINHYVAIAGHLGALVRLLNLPRLVGPGILIVLLYLWFEMRRSRSTGPLPSRVAEIAAPAATALVTLALLAWPFAVR